MMINKRLIGTVSESRKYIAGNVACQWVSLAANITMMASTTRLLARLFEREATAHEIAVTLAVALAAVTPVSAPPEALRTPVGLPVPLPVKKASSSAAP